jgi:hypothetical protein
MATESFETNLLRMIAAELHFQNGMQASREMFGKSYFSLGAGEKAAIDQLLMSNIGSNYVGLTPDFLKTQTSQQPMGFQAPDGAPKQRT